MITTLDKYDNLRRIDIDGAALLVYREPRRIQHPSPYFDPDLNSRFNPEVEIVEFYRVEIDHSRLGRPRWIYVEAPTLFIAKQRARRWLDRLFATFIDSLVPPSA